MTSLRPALRKLPTQRCAGSVRVPCITAFASNCGCPTSTSGLPHQPPTTALCRRRIASNERPPFARRCESCRPNGAPEVCVSRASLHLQAAVTVQPRRRASLTNSPPHPCHPPQPAACAPPDDRLNRSSAVHPTARQPLANRSPTARQPLANRLPPHPKPSTHAPTPSSGHCRACRPSLTG